MQASVVSLEISCGLIFPGKRISLQHCISAEVFGVWTVDFAT